MDTYYYKVFSDLEAITFEQLEALSDKQIEQLIFGHGLENVGDRNIAIFSLFNGAQDQYGKDRTGRLMSRVCQVTDRFVPPTKQFTASELEALGDEAISRLLFGVFVNSPGRVVVTLDLMRQALEHDNPRVFWRAMVHGWPCCDAITVMQQLSMCDLLIERPYGEFRDYLDEDSAAWWSSMKSDAPLRIYRGCSLQRVEALSWTLDRTVAESFARGHRNIRVPNAVIAQASVMWDDVLFATNDREEFEVLVDVDTLDDIDVQPFQDAS